MDYRSPFELRQQLLEDARSAIASSSSPSSTKKKRASPLAGSSSSSPSGKSDSADSKFMPSTALPDDPTALVREVPGADNIRAMNAAMEREEAVQRYVERENLSVEDAAKYFMKNGSTAQRISFFLHINETLVSLNQKRVSKVLAILLDSMWTQDPELQCRAPEIIADFLGLLNVSTAAELLEVVKTMLTVKTAEVRVAWGKLLLKMPGCLRSDQLEEDLMQLAAKKSEYSQPQDQRELSCDLLGASCEFMDRKKVNEIIVPKALALCHDTNVGVRQHICQQLGTIARSLGVEDAKVKIAPDLFELLQDEERGVSQIAFSCLLDLVEFFGSEFRREKLYPIIKSYIERPPKEVFRLLVGEFGRFLVSIKADIASKEETLLFTNFYTTAAASQEGEVRQACAFNFPAVADSLPDYVFPTHLRDCFLAFTRDSLVQVRRSVAAGLHEVVRILGDKAASQLEESFLSILNDEERCVRVLLFRHINEVLDCFVAQLKPTQRTTFFRRVADSTFNMAAKGETSFHNMQYALMILGPYQKYIDPDFLVERFTPVLMNYVKNGANILKNDCAALVMRVTANSGNPTTMVNIFSRVNNEFARSTSCYQRQSYFRFVREASLCYSRRCVRERFLECSLELQRDSVSSVRLALAYTLPFLCKGLRRDTSGALEDEFANMVQRLLMDEDEAVRSATIASKETMKNIEAERKRDPVAAQKEDADNARREKSEQAMLDTAKENDKAERRAKLRDMLKNDRERDAHELPKSTTGSAVKPQRTPLMPSLNKRGAASTSVPPAKSLFGGGGGVAGAGGVGGGATSSTTRRASVTRKTPGRKH